MIVVRPETYSKVDFDSELIQTLAQRSLESVAALPDDLDITVDVDEDQATNRVRLSSIDPVAVEVDGGALENYKVPRTVGELESTITFTRLFLELADRRSDGFGAPGLDEEVSHARRMAWDVNLFGRAGRHGLRIHQPRYRYNFRNRHGFSDLADRTFDELWSADELTWGQIEELSDAALDPVNAD
ncbi:MAG: hypothetical protein ACR2QK_10710 [Acidimicrobiales bacterium]